MNARQVTLLNAPEVAAWCNGSLVYNMWTGSAYGVAVPWSGGVIIAMKGDWVIDRGASGFDVADDETMRRKAV